MEDCKDICPECYKYGNQKKYCLTTLTLFHSSKDNSKPRLEDTRYKDKEDESREVPAQENNPSKEEFLAENDDIQHQHYREVNKE